MCNLNCYYAEDRRFESFFGWLRAMQQCAYNKWLQTCRWLLKMNMDLDINPAHLQFFNGFGFHNF